MYLKYVQIINYKNLKNIRFEFSKGANTIIGENDSGKSNALTAIRILLDDNYYYNTKRLKETDFSYSLGDWKGHWIIISAFFDEISNEDKYNEFCAEITPEQENIDFLKSYIRCTDKDFGTVSLFIRPCRTKRIELAEAAQNGTFESVRSQIKLSDYEFYYTARSQADFTNENIYKSIVGDIFAGQYVNPEDDDQSVLGCKIDIMNVWQHISTVFIDALRDVESELRKPKNPIRQIIDTIEGDIKENDIADIKKKISELNAKISNIPQVSDIGKQVNRKLLEMIGAIYSPEIKLESRLKEDFATLARYLTISPSNQADADGITCLEAAIEKVFALLNIRISKEASLSELKESFFDEIQSRAKKHSLATDFESISKYFGDKNGVVISTLHGVKGEEYTTVIAAGLLNGYLPHWDYIMNPTKKLCRRNETCKLLYVLCSRAKKNLYLFSECGRTTKSGSEYSSTDELSLIADII